MLILPPSLLLLFILLLLLLLLLLLFQINSCMKFMNYFQLFSISFSTSFVLLCFAFFPSFLYWVPLK